MAVNTAGIRNCRLTAKNLVVVDHSYQNESVKTGPIDVRISIELKTPSNENSQAYCLLIHTRLVEYSLLKGLVQRVV